MGTNLFSMKCKISNLGAAAMVCASMLLSANVANAVTVLTLEAGPAPGVQQNSQGPCVIGDPSCNSNPTLPAGYTTLPSGGPGSYGYTPSFNPILSPNYSVLDIRNYLGGGDVFDIGIDVNQANGQAVQTLSYFSMNLVGGGVLAAFGDGTTGTAIGPLNNPGNGYTDWVLSEFSLAGLLDTQEVNFSMAMLIKNGGREQFFITTPVSAVPIPAALPLFGAALFGLGFLSRHRKNKLK